MSTVFGLQPNLGNTCFCKATLKALQHNPILYKILVSHGDGNTCVKGKANACICMHDTKYSAAVSVHC